MNKFNHSAFLNDIKTSQIFMNTFKITNVEEAWNAWIQEYQRIINLHAPCRKIRLPKRNNPWISRFIQTAIYQRDSLHKKAIKSKCPVVTHTIKKANGDYYYRKISSNPSSKKLWATLKNILPSKKSNYSIPRNLSSNDFNKYFSTIG